MGKGVFFLDLERDDRAVVFGEFALDLKCEGFVAGDRLEAASKYNRFAGVRAFGGGARGVADTNAGGVGCCVVD